ncbi:MAG: YggS family pyridoxal phosphate enzyme [Chloroflexota bacterium]|nr:YggS family pyridoxal phosphate enzyme [Chloroflexota bacterium]
MTNDESVDIEANLKEVKNNIAAACARAGRDPDEVTVVAVSKTRSIEEIKAAYACGVRHFGENRIEEAEEKVPQLREAFAADPATWHMVGHVQSRKADRALGCSDIIHSVESPRLIRRLNRFAADRFDTLCDHISSSTHKASKFDTLCDHISSQTHKASKTRRFPILIEVNVSGEESKYGWPAWDEETREKLVERVQILADKEYLDVRGLMTMAPYVEDAEAVRPVFRKMRDLRAMLRERAPFCSWDELSMGMTNDYQVAVEEGATIVRIGRAIFGPAEYFWQEAS